MKKTEKVPSEVTKVTWFCDVCGKKISEGHSTPTRCVHCGKDVCHEHFEHFRKSVSYQCGFYHRMGPSISVSLCDNCQKIELTYRKFLDLFFKEVRIHGKPRPV